jgi:hypothetical protein
VGDFPSFDCHPTLAGMLSPTLIGDQVVQGCQPSQTRRLTPVGVREALHHEQVPVDSIGGLIQ